MRGSIGECRGEGVWDVNMTHVDTRTQINNHMHSKIGSTYCTRIQFMLHSPLCLLPGLCWLVEVSVHATSSPHLGS